MLIQAPPRNSTQNESLELDTINDRISDGLLSSPILDTPPISPSSWFRRVEDSPIFQKVFRYPSPASLKIRPTSWLDGLRGVAAFEVYVFHAFSCWIHITSAWLSDGNSTYIFQFPFIRTFFASGGAAVSLFFSISGYVLTQKCLRFIRDASPHQVYPSVKSSMFRRGFRLYLPPIIVTFAEMIATRFGFAPPLNFTFVPEPTSWGQFLDWASQTNRWMNPIMHIFHGIFRHEYEAVVWTIPFEFYGSFVCYFLLLALAKVPQNRVRMGSIAIFAILSMGIGYWSLFCFATGMLIADFHLSQEAQETSLPPNKTPSSTPTHQRLWWLLFLVAFYIAGLPALWDNEAYSRPKPGFETLLNLTPPGFSLSTQAGSRFWWSLSGTVLMLSISQLAPLKRFFETPFCQYLGKISFSLYLIHQFSLVLFGLAIRAFLRGLFGVDDLSGEGPAFWISFMTWFVLFTGMLFVVAGQVERWVDAPTVRFSKWLEGRVFGFLQQK